MMTRRSWTYRGAKTQRQQAEEENPEKNRLELMMMAEPEMNNLRTEKRQARQ